MNSKQNFIKGTIVLMVANAISKILGAIFKMTKLINNYIRNKETSLNTMNYALKSLTEMLWVLGIEVEVQRLTPEEKKLVNDWNAAKAEKNFELADKLRAEIVERNIVL